MGVYDYNINRTLVEIKEILKEINKKLDIVEKEEK